MKKNHRLMVSILPYMNPTIGTEQRVPRLVGTAPLNAQRSSAQLRMEPDTASDALSGRLDQTRRQTRCLVLVENAIETGALTGVAGRPRWMHECEQAVGIAIVAQLHELLDIAARLALMP